MFKNYNNFEIENKTLAKQAFQRRTGDLSNMDELSETDLID